MNVVVLIPTYNERENIKSHLDALESVSKKIPHHTFSFLVIDDNSPDGTREIVESYRRTHKNIFITSGHKEGLGKALLRGMRFAIHEMNAEIIVQIDADHSHNPASLPDFMRKIDAGADFVVGSRYIPGGSIPRNWGLHRKIYSILGNAIVRFGIGYATVHDWTGGYRAYHSKYIEASEKELTSYGGYVFQIAFLDKSIQKGAKVAEVPIQFTDRLFGHSKIAPSQYIRDILLYVARSRWSRLVHGTFGKFLVVGGMGFVINSLILELFVWSGFHPVSGSMVGAELAIVSNFFINNAWTFRHRKITGLRKIRKFLQFNVTSFGALLIQAGIVAFGTNISGVDSYRIYYIMGVGLGLLWNYFMYKKVIWK